MAAGDQFVALAAELRLPEGALSTARYLHDPAEHPTPHLLATAGAAVAASVPGDVGATLEGFDTQREFKSTAPLWFSAAQGAADAEVHIRDSADCWIAVQLAGDTAAVQVAAGKWVRVAGPVAVAGAAADAVTHRFAEAGGAAEQASNRPYWEFDGMKRMRELVCELCHGFYTQGWASGTGGSISIRHGERIYMAPSGVQKERMIPSDIFTLDLDCNPIYFPPQRYGERAPKLSECAPLFSLPFRLRDAGACIHSHHFSTVLATELFDRRFEVTNMEMIKGIKGHGFNSTLSVPIINNTPRECELTGSLSQALETDKLTSAVLVRRHGVYIWGDTWQKAKAQAECYHYLFEAASKLKQMGVDPAVPAPAQPDVNSPASAEDVAQAKQRRQAMQAAEAEAAAAAAAGRKRSRTEAAAATGNGESGFKGAAGTAGAGSAGPLSTPVVGAGAMPVVPSDGFSCVLLDIEGCTTPISFVHDTLFPFAAKQLAAHLDRLLPQDKNQCTPEGRTALPAESQELLADIDALRTLAQADAAAGVTGAIQIADPASAGRAEVARTVADSVAWQMGQDRKSGPLKQLQGHIWRAGYAAGQLQGQLFPEVKDFLAAVAGAGKKSYIYSSGSREAQRLLFKHSTAGDVRPLLSGYFDTAMGSKKEAQSYREICLSLGVDEPREVVFFTDSTAEADAAAAAGLVVVLTDRAGNTPLPAAYREAFPVVTALEGRVLGLDTQMA